MVAGDVIQMAASMDCLKIHFHPNDVETKHFFMPKVSGYCHETYCFPFLVLFDTNLHE